MSFHRTFRVIFHGRDGATWEGKAEVACEGEGTTIALANLARAIKELERGVPPDARSGVAVAVVSEPASSQPERKIFTLGRASPVAPWFIAEW
jgi:hypothetical protein